jgi:hypothetical protein
MRTFSVRYDAYLLDDLASKSLQSTLIRTVIDHLSALGYTCLIDCYVAELLLHLELASAKHSGV